MYLPVIIYYIYLFDNINITFISKAQISDFSLICNVSIYRKNNIWCTSNYTTFVLYFNMPWVLDQNHIFCTRGNKVYNSKGRHLFADMTDIHKAVIFSTDH